MENFRDSENHQWRYAANPTLQNRINSLRNYDHRLFDQFQNPNSSRRHPQPSLEDVFSRMNLNNMQTTRTGSAIFPSSFMDYNDFDIGSSSQQPRTTSFDANSLWSDSTSSIHELLQYSPSRDFHISWDELYLPELYLPSRVSRARDRLSRDWSLMELNGRVCATARDQNGCRLMQKILDHDRVTRQEIDMVFVEVMHDDLHELMVHQFANYLVHKLFNAIDQQQRTRILELLVSNHRRLFQVCTNTNGSRTIQKFVERITTEDQMHIFLSALEPMFVLLTNNVNGHHIIQQCLYKFQSDYITHLMDQIVDNCYAIATNKYGCCVLQQCLQYASPNDRDRLLVRITANVLLLSEDEFGNYVVQFVLGLRYPYATAQIIRLLEGNFVALSFNKYGSHVVQKCLEQSDEQLSSRIIREIINNPDDFVKVIGHGYGNYVIQSALFVAKGDIRNALLASIRNNYALLRSSPFGSRVLSRAKSRNGRI